MRQNYIRKKELRNKEKRRKEVPTIRKLEE
jgi:hypothetical protein